MASTYSTNLRLEVMAIGENSNTWGAKTSTNLNLIEQAVSGVASVAMTDADYTLTTSNAATDEARNAVITMTGTLTQARNVIVPSVDKVYIFKNSTTGGFGIVVKTSAGTGVTVPNGETAQVYCDATNVEVSATAVGKIALTQPATGATFTLLDGKTLTVSNTLTLAGTDGTTMTFPATSATIARTDAAQTFTGTQTFSGLIEANLGLTVAGAAFNSRGITDSATTKALTLSGSGANSVTIANSATNPTIGTSAGNLFFNPAAQGNVLLLASGGASTVNHLQVTGAIAGGAVGVSATGADADVQLSLSSRGGDSVGLYTNAFMELQVSINRTAAADRYITLTGSAGGNPTIGTSAGNLAITPAVVGGASLSASTFVSANHYMTIYAAATNPAGGAANCAVYFSSTAIGLQVGSGVPTTTIVDGSIYIRTDGGVGTTIYQRRAGVWVATAA